MNNLTLIIAMSLGLLVLGTFANSNRMTSEDTFSIFQREWNRTYTNSNQTKVMYKGKLPVYFKDNGRLQCPEANPEFKGKLRKFFERRFGTFWQDFARFQVICYLLALEIIHIMQFLVVFLNLPTVEE